MNNPPRNSLFDALAEAIFAVECPGIRYTEQDQEFYRKAAKAAWMQMHAPVEPVAWRWRYEGDTTWTVGRQPPVGGEIDLQPLYTYPEAMTDGQRLEIAKIIAGDIFKDIPDVIPGAATRYARKDALDKANKILALLTSSS